MRVSEERIIQLMEENSMLRADLRQLWEAADTLKAAVYAQADYEVTHGEASVGLDVDVSEAQETLDDETKSIAAMYGFDKEGE